MNYTLDSSSGTNFTKLAFVGALHVAVGFAIVHSTNIIDVFGPLAAPVNVIFVPEPPKPLDIEPPLPDLPKPRTEKPMIRDIVVPVIDHDVPLDDGPVIHGTNEPAPIDPGPFEQPQQPKAEPAANPGKMRTAVLADANACGMPEYPTRSARNGESGTVGLALLVGIDGRVADSRIQTTSGFRELDRAAVAALSMCKFKPATNGGAPEQAWAQISYKWTLD